MLFPSPSPGLGVGRPHGEPGELFLFHLQFCAHHRALFLPLLRNEIGALRYKGSDPDQQVCGKFHWFKVKLSDCPMLLSARNCSIQRKQWARRILRDRAPEQWTSGGECPAERQTPRTPFSLNFPLLLSLTPLGPPLMAFQGLGLMVRSPALSAVSNVNEKGTVL